MKNSSKNHRNSQEIFFTIFYKTLLINSPKISLFSKIVCSIKKSHHFQKMYYFTLKKLSALFLL